MPLGRIAGIQIRMDWSLLIIFGLIMFSLALGLLPSWHPDWSAAQNWVVAALAAALLIGSVLLHELAHAIVGRRFGAQVRRITLFVFGGISHVEREPEDWRGALWMALAGPATSFVIGIVCLLLGGLLTGLDQIQPDRPEATVSNLGPTATVLLWLGPINLLLALFNLLPGFPLDGGRVLLAGIWAVTGDRDRATRWASWLGQGLGLALVALGLAMAVGLQVPLLGTGLVSGLWLILIGWFLHNAALAGRRQREVQARLSGVPVERLMLSDVPRLSPDTRVQEVVESHLIGRGQRHFAVVENDRLLGLLALRDLQSVPPEERNERRISEIMTPRDKLISLRPHEDGAEALTRLSRHDVGQLPVLEGDRLLGLVTRDNVFNYLILKQPPRGGHRQVTDRTA